MLVHCYWLILWVTPEAPSATPPVPLTDVLPTVAVAAPSRAVMGRSRQGRRGSNVRGMDLAGEARRRRAMRWQRGGVARAVAIQYESCLFRVDEWYGERLPSPSLI